MRQSAAKEYRHHGDVIDGWEVRVTSYALGGTWCCRVDNVSPGATVARARSRSREEAELEAIERARQLLRTTVLFRASR